MARFPKPPAPGLVDTIAKAVDGWHATHPDLTVGEIIEAFRIVRNQLAKSATRQSS